MWVRLWHQESTCEFGWNSTFLSIEPIWKHLSVWLNLIFDLETVWVRLKPFATSCEFDWNHPKPCNPNSTVAFTRNNLFTHRFFTTVHRRHYWLNACTLACTHAYERTRTHAYARVRTGTHEREHTYTHARMQVHTHTHKHTHTHTHSYMHYTLYI